MIVTMIEGRKLIAGALRGEAPSGSGNWRVELFKSDTDLAVDTAVADVTPCVFDGYAPIDTDQSETGAIVMDGDDAKVRLRDDPFVWDCTAAPETIYGWILFNTDNDHVYFGEKYETPHVLQVGSRHTLFIDLKFGQCG